MEAERSSETSVRLRHTSWRHIPQYSTQSSSWQNPKSQVLIQASSYFTARHFKCHCNFTPSVCSFDRPWRKTRPWDSSRSMCQRHWVQLRVVPSTTWRKWVLYADVSAYGFTWMERTPVGNVHSFCWLSYDRSKPSSKARSPQTAI